MLYGGLLNIPQTKNEGSNFCHRKKSNKLYVKERKMRKWLYWHFPIITTRLKRYSYTERFVNDAVAKNNKAYDNFIKFKDKSTWAAINPVIHSLQELRNNTWDKERVDHAIKWLRDNFEVRDDNT